MNKNTKTKRLRTIQRPVYRWYDQVEGGATVQEIIAKYRNWRPDREFMRLVKRGSKV